MKILSTSTSTAFILATIVAAIMTVTEAVLTSAPVAVVEEAVAACVDPACLANCQIAYANHINNVCNKKTGLPKTLCKSTASLSLKTCRSKS